MDVILTLLFIFFILPLIFRLLRPFISRMLQKLLVWYSRRKTEEFMSRAMGIDPKEARKRRKQEEKRQRGNAGSSSSSSFFRGKGDEFFRGRGDRAYTSGHIIPPEYAEDVDFTEIKEFDTAEICPDAKAETKIKVEEQISDAEWEDISK